jgi:putative ABC transport system permease protein
MSKHPDQDRFSFRRLILRGLRYYGRRHMTVMAGVALASAVLTGALLVGDSAFGTLQNLALLRLGKTHFAAETGSRTFAADLANRLSAHLNAPASPMLALQGVALADGKAGRRQLNRCHVFGITDSFRTFGEQSLPTLGAWDAAVNRQLARALGIETGDTLVLRMPRGSLLPGDAPLASRGDDVSRRLTLTVRHILDDSRLGRFSLRANQTTPFNVFVSLSMLQEAVSLPGRANICLAGPGADSLTLSAWQAAVADVWRLEDAGLYLRDREGVLQLESDRVFLPRSVSTVARRCPGAVGALTYLVSGFSTPQGRKTPYAFVTAVDPGPPALSPVPPEMRDDQIIVNSWLADVLDVTPGDTVEMNTYQLVQAGFEKRSRVFTVFRVDPVESLEAERRRVPAFPGLTDVERCRDWDIGMPTEGAALRDAANEAYWSQWRETPKAFITLRAGQALWANRFGDMTAVRYPVEAAASARLGVALRRALDPKVFGLVFQPVREQAMRAVKQSLDFGQLFLAMSAFLILSALTLTGLLFVFQQQERSAESGALRTCGFTPQQVVRVQFGEAVVVALAGSVVGALAGLGYTRIMLVVLSRYWQGAVAGTAMVFHARLLTLAAGAGSALVCAVAVLGVAMRSMAKRTIIQQLAGTAARDDAAGTRAPALLPPVIAGLAAIAAIVAAGFSGPRHWVAAFFGAGTVVLIASLVLIRTFLLSQAFRNFTDLRIAGLVLRGASRRPGRSLTTTALVACGCFLVFSVASMQHDVADDAERPSSGTGGFALWAESSLALPDPLNHPRTSDRLLGAAPMLADMRSVSMKVREGDDASCFNLNRAQTPRLIAVDPVTFAECGAFESGHVRSPWEALDASLPPGVVPGLAGDTDTAMWGLQQKTGPEGGVLTYVDEEGHPLSVKLVGALPMRLSVFQGSVLIEEAAFMKHFPSESGYRIFLVDTPTERAEAVAAMLAHRLERFGLTVESTVDRLRAFYSVEATYLRMFLILGGLGVALGAVGMGIVLMRNVRERKPELAMLRCVGYSRRHVACMLFLEHAMLLILGAVTGSASALVAMWPGIKASETSPPLGAMLVILAAIFAVGLVWIGLAVWWMSHLELVPALRDE